MGDRTWKTSLTKSLPLPLGLRLIVGVHVYEYRNRVRIMPEVKVRKSIKVI